jgi:hypothetical protein
VAFRRRRSLTVRDVLLVMAIVLVFLGVSAALVTANLRWSAVLPGGNEFFSIWSGARGFLLRGADPYTAVNAATAQELSGMSLSAESPDRFRLNLPFFLVPFFFPLALIPDPDLARALWALLGQATVVGTVFLTLRLVEWDPPRGLVVGFCVLAMLSVPVVAAMLDGTTAVLLVLVYVGVLWAMATGRDELAGGLLAVSLFRWEIGLPFLILVGWRVLHEQRMRIAAGFGMALVLLVLLSFLLYPGWVLPFLTASTAVFRQSHGMNMGGVFARLLPQYSLEVAVAVAVISIGTLIFEWAVGRDSEFRRFVWITCMALAATPLIGMRTELSDLIVVLPGMVLILVSAQQRGRMGAWLGALLLVALLVLPWVLVRQWLADHAQRAHDLLFLIIPGLSVLGLYWTRWWFLRPARTWLDEVRAWRR